MKDSNEKTYVLVTLTDFDRDIITRRMTKDEIIEKTKDLDYNEFVVLDGKVIKDETKKFQKHLLK